MFLLWWLGHGVIHLHVILWYARCDSNARPSESELSGIAAKCPVYVGFGASWKVSRTFWKRLEPAGSLGSCFFVLNTWNLASPKSALAPIPEIWCSTCRLPYFSLIKGCRVSLTRIAKIRPKIHSMWVSAKLVQKNLCDEPQELHTLEKSAENKETPL